MFFGIAIKIFYREHNPPDFHPCRQGFEALFNINTGKLMKGRFHPKACKILFLKRPIKEYRVKI